MPESPSAHTKTDDREAVGAARAMPEPVADTVRLVSTIACPHCGHLATETMPTDACIYFYECANCGAALKPKRGHCCVFCSYGDTPCPPIQASRSCCG